MSTNSETSLAFAIPAFSLEPLKGPAAEDRYLVTLQETNRNLVVTPKLAALLSILNQGLSLDETAARLSSEYGRPLTVDDVTFIIERQMLPKGLAYRTRRGHLQNLQRGRVIQKDSLGKRLLAGTFRFRLVPTAVVERICAPLSPAYDWVCILLALILVGSTRWLLYTNMDWVYYRQSLLRMNSLEYLLDIGLLTLIVLLHELGHATAQLRMGIPPGHIGFQLYYYIPTLFANVDGSWRLPPRRRAVVDLGGVYFQSIAASLLYLIYLKIHSTPMIAAVLSSDLLTIVALNPFLKFDGYWLLSDVLAVPNLDSESRKLRRHYWRKLWRSGPGQKPRLALSSIRKIAVALYSALRQAFWIWLTYAFLRGVPRFATSARSIVEKLSSRSLTGIRTQDPAMIFAAILQFILFALLLLTIGTFLLQMTIGTANAVREIVGAGLGRRKGAPVPNEKRIGIEERI
ncbi:MAG: hypothetical protein ACREDR_02900 [Blastocatellia bacterium]